MSALRAATPAPHDDRARDLTGRVYVRLTVLRRAASTAYGAARWVCACVCGREVTVLAQSLVLGKTRSCGCLRREHAFGRAGTPPACAWCGARGWWTCRDEDGDLQCRDCADAAESGSERSGR